MCIVKLQRLYRWMLGIDIRCYHHCLPLIEPFICLVQLFHNDFMVVGTFLWRQYLTITISVQNTWNMAINQISSNNLAYRTPHLFELRYETHIQKCIYVRNIIFEGIPLLHIIIRGYPAKRALSAMRSMAGRALLAGYRPYKGGIASCDTTKFTFWDIYQMLTSFEITYLLQNVSSGTIEVLEWTSNLISLFTRRLITYPCWDEISLISIKWSPPWWRN